MNDSDQRPAGDLKRIATPMTQTEIDAVDEWGFARKIRNRTDVIRELVRKGLEASALEKI